MPAKPQPVPPAPTARTEEPVRIFSVGQTLPSGRVADEAFLDAVVANWTGHQAKGDPTFPKPPAYLVPAASVTLGHERNSSLAAAYAERTDLPAVGWPDRVWRDGRYLMAHLRGIPAGLAAWVQAGVWGERSAEFYEDYQGHGPTLRRVSLLGAEVPACKDLGPMPRLVFDAEAERDPNPLAFSERLADMAKRHRRFAVGLGVGPGPGHLVTFSESNPAPARTAPMTPQQQALYDALAALGVDTSKLDGAALDAILKACAPPAAPAVQPVATNADPVDPTKQMAAFSELAAKAAAAAVTAAMGPVQGQLKATETQLAGVTARLAASDHAAARAQVATFCETHKDKIFPFELDATLAQQKGTATLIDQLLALPADCLATFAEGKVSPRAAAMAAVVARLPIARFAERLAQPLTPTDAAAEAKALLGLTPTGKGALAALAKA